MPGTWRRRPSPAIVIAVIALIAALGGSAIAATELVIRDSSQIRSGAIELKDLSKKARKALQGQRGPAGGPGPAGAPGVPGERGAPGERGPSNAYSVRKAGINSPACPTEGCASPSTLATMSLPAGNFIVTGSATLAPKTSVANAEYSIECFLVRGSNEEILGKALNFYKAPAGGTTPDETMVVNSAVTLASPGTVYLSCQFGNVNFTATSPQITAVQAATLSNTTF